MKKAFLAVFLILLLIFSGCAPDVPDISPVPENTPERTPALTPEPMPEPAETPLPMQETVTLFESDQTVYSMAGSEKLFAVILQDPYQEGADYKENARLLTFDIETGNKRGDIQLEQPYVDLVVFPGGVATWSWDGRTVQVYEEDLTPRWSKKLSMRQTATLFPDGFCYVISGDRSIVRISLTDQSEQKGEVPEDLKPFDVLSCRGAESLIRCNIADGPELDDLWLNWETGATRPAELPEDVNIYRSMFYQTVSGSEQMYLRDLFGDRVYAVPVPDSGVWTVESFEERALLAGQDGGLAFCDLKKGESRQLSTESIIAAALCGDYVVYCENSAPQRLTRWAPPCTETGILPIAVLTEHQISEENQKIAEAIHDETGMPVYFGRKALDYNKNGDSSYVSDLLEDPLKVRVALVEMQRFVREYPEGLFQEMRPGNDLPIRIYITGRIKGSSNGLDGTISSPVGFTMNNETEQIIVLDASAISSGDRFRATLAHELMHVMEQKMLERGREKGLEYFAYWDSFIPSPYLYYYSYHDDDGYEVSDIEYTSQSEMPREEVLFLDAYSRTKPTEDRARIMEHLYLGEKSEYADQLQVGIMKKKAQYLCAIIRDSFKSCQTEERLLWERVDPVPFAEYEQAVREYEPEALG